MYILGGKRARNFCCLLATFSHSNHVLAQQSQLLHWVLLTTSDSNAKSISKVPCNLVFMYICLCTTATSLDNNQEVYFQRKTIPKISNIKWTFCSLQEGVSFQQFLYTCADQVGVKETKAFLQLLSLFSALLKSKAHVHFPVWQGPRVGQQSSAVTADLQASQLTPLQVKRAQHLHFSISVNDLSLQETENHVSRTVFLSCSLYLYSQASAKFSPQRWNSIHI